MDLTAGQMVRAYFGDESHHRLRRQQQGRGVMIWAGLLGLSEYQKELK